MQPNKPCNNWAQSGSCKFGDSCRYMHGDQASNSGGGGRNFGGGGNRNFQNQGPGNQQNFNNQNNQGFNSNPNFGGNKGGKPFGKGKGKREFRFNPTSICNHFQRSNCTHGSNCNKHHEFSIQWDVENVCNIGKYNKKCEVHSADLVKGWDGGIAFVIGAKNLIQITAIDDKGDTKELEVKAPEGEITCVFVEKQTTFLLVGAQRYNKKCYVAVYKMGDNENYELIVNSEELYDGIINAIDAEVFNGGIKVVVAGTRLQFLFINSDGKFIDMGNDFIKDVDLISVKCIGFNALAGGTDGKTHLFTYDDQNSKVKVTDDFRTHPDTTGCASSISWCDDCIYSVTYPRGSNFSNVSFYTQGTKITNLCNISVDFQACVITNIPFEENIIIGCLDGELKFFNKDGFEVKGWAKIHSAPIKAILNYGAIAIVIDQTCCISVWKFLSEKDSHEKRENYKNAQQQDEGNFGNQYGGDQQMGGGMMSSGFQGGFK